jgi:hypothetical protein
VDGIAAYGPISMKNVGYILLFYDKVAFTLNPASLVSRQGAAFRPRDYFQPNIDARRASNEP